MAFHSVPFSLDRSWEGEGGVPSRASPHSSITSFLTGQAPVFHLKCLWIYTNNRSHLSSVNHPGAGAAARHVPRPIYDPRGKSNGTQPSMTLGGVGVGVGGQGEEQEQERGERERLLMLLQCVLFPVCSGCFCDPEWNSRTTEPTDACVADHTISIHPLIHFLPFNGGW